MAEYYSAQKQGQNQNNKPGQLVIKAHYAAEDDSADMVYSFKCPSDVSRIKNDVWTMATGIYMSLEKSISMIDDLPELNLVKMTVHEVFYDDDGSVKLDCYLDQYTY
jgi:hypothetical protein